MCPPGYSKRAVAIANDAAAAAGRPPPSVVQYMPCAVRTGRDEARHLAKTAIGEMLATFWPVGADWPALRETIVQHSGITKAEMISALERLRRGEPAARVLDDRFVEAFAIAGTAQDCLTAAARYRRAGVGELVLTFCGTQPDEDMAYLGRAIADHRPDGA